MERKEIEKRVNDVLNEVLGVDYSAIKGDAVLSDDLNADSLDAVEIVMGLEHEFGISIPDDILFGQDDVTVGQIYDFVEQKVS